MSRNGAVEALATLLADEWVSEDVFTRKDILKWWKVEKLLPGTTPNMSTIKRALDVLVSEGVVSKEDGWPILYQFTPNPLLQEPKEESKGMVVSSKQKVEDFLLTKSDWGEANWANLFADLQISAGRIECRALGIPVRAQ